MYIRAYNFIIIIKSMTSSKTNDYKELIPEIKIRANSTKNRRHKFIKKINLVPDPELTLLSANDFMNMSHLFQKECVFGIKSFFSNFVLEQARVDLIENKCDYSELFLSFKNLIIEQLDIIQNTLKNLTEKRSKFAANFFDDFKNGDLSDDSKFIERFEQLVQTFAIKTTAPSDSEIYENLKNYFNKEKDWIIEKLAQINSNLSKELTQSNLNDFLNSAIIKPSEHAMVSEWVKDQVGATKVFKPLFNSQDHGFSSQTFHSKCDEKGPTIVLVKTTSGRRFGGYANSSWHSDNKWISDEKCFIFSLDFREKYLHKPGNQKSIWGASYYGPAFGEGHDFYICDNCNIHNQSYFNNNGSYNHGLHTAQDIAGVLPQPNNCFTVKNFEVYQVQ